MSEKIVAYKLTRSGCDGWIVLGPNTHDIGVAVANELDGNGGMPADECDTITLTPFETIQEHLDGLPEFDGW